MHVIYMLLCAILSALPGTSGVKSPPQMGFSSYNAYGVHITDTEVRATADAMASLGLRDLGYKFINVDGE